MPTDRGLFRVDMPEQSSGLWEIKRWEVDKPQRHMGYDVQPGTYTALRRFEDDYAWHTWMSDITSEVLCALPFVEQARGDVLVTGLGLGTILRPLAARPEVETITVVELDETLAAMVWPTYKAIPKLNLVVGNALRPQRLRLPMRRFTCAWHDIWRDISAKNLVQMHHMRKAWPVDGLTMCWSETEARDQLRREAARAGKSPQLERAFQRLHVCNVDGG